MNWSYHTANNPSRNPVLFEGLLFTGSECELRNAENMERGLVLGGKGKYKFDGYKVTSLFSENPKPNPEQIQMDFPIGKQDICQLKTLFPIYSIDVEIEIGFSFRISPNTIALHKYADNSLDKIQLRYYRQVSSTGY
ncbi:hypothetical protein BB560_005925 [Smittium megazygosporum]|uniref:Uncharacterized protein n=1 Tax=Smittium megazygosporum TaxID=133381 RepID=A0A2T9YQK0_9FUNG|nr:hypothetical protein BB560_005925 [Smittium megazygosporum]